MSEYIPHWAESLKQGDKVNATIRSNIKERMNRHNVEVIILSVDRFNKNVTAYDKSYQEHFTIPFNELKKL